MLVLVLSEAVLAIEKDGKSRRLGRFEHEHRRKRLSTSTLSCALLHNRARIFCRVPAYSFPDHAHHEQVDYSTSTGDV